MRVASVAPLARLGRLHTLLLNRTSVADVSPLATLDRERAAAGGGGDTDDNDDTGDTGGGGGSALEVLNLYATPVASVAPLAPCGRLRRVLAVQCVALAEDDVATLRATSASATLAVRHTRAQPAPLAG